MPKSFYPLLRGKEEEKSFWFRVDGGRKNLLGNKCDTKCKKKWSP